jgi:hypothetical protein
MNWISTLDLDPAPRIIFGNTVNRLMVTVPTPGHSATLAAISHRKLWLAKCGDIIIVHQNPSQAFRRYSCELIGIDTDSIRTIEIHGGIKPLAESIKSYDLEKEIQHAISQYNNVNLHCYALDQPTWQFARNLRINLLEYDDFPDLRLVKLISRFNSKEGFRQLASRLGLPLVPGVFCDGLERLLKETRFYLSAYGKVIIKLNRSSNAYGNIILENPINNVQLKDFLLNWRNSYPEQPEEYIVEEYKPFIGAPSIEMFIGETGPQVTYLCDQYFQKGLFSGMVSPPSLEKDAVSSALNEAAIRVGDYLFETGYRGIVDLDAGLTAAGDLFFTEINARRTAGTFIHELICRLSGNSGQYPAWISNSISKPRGLDFSDGVKKLTESSLAYHHGRGTGVILLADTLSYDRHWRYLTISPGLAEAKELERRLCHQLA